MKAYEGDSSRGFADTEHHIGVRSTKQRTDENFFSYCFNYTLEITESVVYFDKSSDWTISIPAIVGVFNRILIFKINGKIIHNDVQNINLEPTVIEL